MYLSGGCRGDLQDADQMERGGDEQTRLPRCGGPQADGEEGAVSLGSGEAERAPGPVGHVAVAEAGCPAPQAGQRCARRSDNLVSHQDNRVVNRTTG